MTDTPKKLGYRLPAEWETHFAVWLAWPHDTISFGSLNEPSGIANKERLFKVEQKFAETIAAIAVSENVELLVLDEPMKTQAEALLTKLSADLSKITFHIVDYADVWVRDYGPLFINGPQTSKPAWIKWTYNAYGEKFKTLIKDNEVFFKLRGAINQRMFEPETVLESGAIECNGKGTLITTEQCLINSNRNPDKNKSDYEKCFQDYLSIGKIIWLKQGLFNDHTDGHVDEIARFVAADTIVCAYEEDETDPNFKILEENYQTLAKTTDQDGKPFKLVKLPMPHMVYHDGQKAPVSYCNFYIGNTVVLAATFNDPNDEKALKIIQSCFPNRKVVPIDCTDIIYGGGAVHCMTQQQPI
jgi:agmatine deiminase